MTSRAFFRCRACGEPVMAGAYRCAVCGVDFPGGTPNAPDRREPGAAPPPSSAADAPGPMEVGEEAAPPEPTAPPPVAPQRAIIPPPPTPPITPETTAPPAATDAAASPAPPPTAPPSTETRALRPRALKPRPDALVIDGLDQALSPEHGLDREAHPAAHETAPSDGEPPLDQPEAAAGAAPRGPKREARPLGAPARVAAPAREPTSAEEPSDNREASDDLALAVRRATTTSMEAARGRALPRRQERVRRGGRIGALLATVFVALLVLGLGAIVLERFDDGASSPEVAAGSPADEASAQAPEGGVPRSLTIEAGDGWVSLPRGHGPLVLEADVPFRLRVRGKVYTIEPNTAVRVPRGRGASIAIRSIRPSTSARVREL